METCNPRPPVLVDVRETARLLGISDRSVWRMSQRGDLPQPIHLGRSARWRVADLLSYIHNRPRPGAAAAPIVQRLGP